MEKSRVRWCEAKGGGVGARVRGMRGRWWAVGSWLLAVGDWLFDDGYTLGLVTLRRGPLLEQ